MEGNGRQTSREGATGTHLEHHGKKEVLTCHLNQRAVGEWLPWTSEGTDCSADALVYSLWHDSNTLGSYNLDAPHLCPILKAASGKGGYTSRPGVMRSKDDVSIHSCLLSKCFSSPNWKALSHSQIPATQEHKFNL